MDLCMKQEKDESVGMEIVEISRLEEKKVVYPEVEIEWVDWRDEIICSYPSSHEHWNLWKE